MVEVGVVESLYQVAQRQCRHSVQWRGKDRMGELNRTHNPHNTSQLEGRDTRLIIYSS